MISDTNWDVKSMEENRNEIILKAIGKPAYSNCFLAFGIVQEKINQGKMFVFCETDIVVLLEKKDGCYQFYYFLSQKEIPGTSWVNLKMQLEEYGPLKLELISKSDKAVYNTVVSNLNFSLYKTYLRKSFFCGNIIKPYREMLDTDTAKPEDVNYIYDMLMDTFDLISDYIFDKGELMDLILKGNILKIVLAGEIAGVLIFEDTKYTSYAKVLCINEKYRNNVIGYALFAKYINMHLSFIKLFYLWVDKDNHDVLGLHNKFGYKEDRLKDYIFVRR